MIGVVTGLRAEARCLPPEVGRTVASSGGDAERARSTTQGLIDRGACGLMSFGLAGGLGAAAWPGDLLLPEVVVLPTGVPLSIDREWRGRLEARLCHAGLRIHGGALAGSDRLLRTVEAKRALHEATGALAVDMESHVVAAIACRAGVPFIVIRAIADPHDRPLPRAATTALGPDGKVRLGAVAAALLARPSDLLPLLRLGRQSGLALATLRRVALVAGAALDLQ